MVEESHQRGNEVCTFQNESLPFPKIWSLQFPISVPINKCMGIVVFWLLWLPYILSFNLAAATMSQIPERLAISGSSKAVSFQ